MNWFLDNNLAPGLAEAMTPVLRTMLHRDDCAKHLREMFDENAKDHEWLRGLNPKGSWAIISGDVDIVRVPAERQAWIESGHIAFFLSSSWTEITPIVQLGKLAKILPSIVKLADRLVGPVGFLVPVSSTRFRQIYPDKKVGE